MRKGCKKEGETRRKVEERGRNGRGEGVKGRRRKKEETRKEKGRL